MASEQQRDRFLEALSRRRLLVGGGAALAAAGLAPRLGALAQDTATPVPDNSGVEPGADVATPTAELPAVPPEFEVETNWPVEGGDLKAHRFARGSGISSETIGQLGLAWSAPITTVGLFGALTSNPIIAGDLVYVQDAVSNVYAFNKETGEQVWFNEYNDTVPTGGPNGVAIAYGNAYFTLGGLADVIGAKADTGEELWRTNILGPLHEGITMAPSVYDGVVYVSTIPGSVDGFYQGGQRGVIHALDAQTGEVIWYFDTTTDNLWGNARVNSGGGIWHPPSFDDQGNVYVGIANAAPFVGTDEFPGATSRPGDNDYANALMRINPETASYDWYINVKPHDLFDHDNHLTPILATVNVNGADTLVAFAGGKHGFVVAANAETGEELWRTPVGEHNENENLQDLGVDETVEVLPGFIGGIETSMAFVDNKIICPVLNVPFTTNGSDQYSGDIFGGVSELVAVDASTGEIAWSVDIPTMTLAGATVANDVIFTAGLDGLVRGHLVADGSEVFRYQCPAGVNAQLAISGDYLFVPAGAPFSPNDDRPELGGDQSNEFIALKLGGEVQDIPVATPAG
jgi:outer membrane protein assembly factor BamB